jgi:phage shock protein PspC (stress-responsive transcriptional regulator)
MQGTILSFSINTNSGLISGDDGIRYSFTGSAWRAEAYPSVGVSVDFVQSGRIADDIYCLTASVGSTTVGTENGFYRSANDAIIGGVFGGLAHKWKVNPWIVRFFGLILLYGIPIYLIAWFCLPVRSTSSAKPDPLPTDTLSTIPSRVGNLRHRSDASAAPTMTGKQAQSTVQSDDAWSPFEKGLAAVLAVTVVFAIGALGTVTLAGARGPTGKANDAQSSSAMQAVRYNDCMARLNADRLTAMRQAVSDGCDSYARGNNPNLEAIFARG